MEDPQARRSPEPGRTPAPPPVGPRPPLPAILLTALLAGLGLPGPVVHAQQPERPQSSPNVELVAHVPLEGGVTNTADVELEQELSRPYAYVARARYAQTGVIGFDVIDLRNPREARVLHRWRIENTELHQGPGALDLKYFRLDDRTYLVVSFQFAQGGPDHALGAIVFDVTDLPDDAPEEVARIRYPDAPGGFHNIFMYHHSDDRALLFATTTGDHAAVFDMERVVEERDSVLAGRVPVPDNPIGEAFGSNTYHDFYVAWHPGSGQDRFYGGGTGGYYVYDVTALSNPKLLVSLNGIPGVNRGHTITPGPRGRYIVTETERLYAPLRIFDLKPGLDGDARNIRVPISAWTANWRNLSHNHEVRWPYVFVAAYEDGLQVFNMFDPEDPKTVGWYDTYPGPHRPEFGGCTGNICVGAFGVDVRDADGLIVISDDVTGFWAFRMKGFTGWDGDTWGVPDVSSVQDWETAPGTR